MLATLFIASSSENMNVKSFQSTLHDWFVIQDIQKFQFYFTKVLYIETVHYGVSRISAIKPQKTIGFLFRIYVLFSFRNA